MDEIELRKIRVQKAVIAWKKLQRLNKISDKVGTHDWEKLSKETNKRLDDKYGVKFKRY